MCPIEYHPQLGVSYSQTAEAKEAARFYTGTRWRKVRAYFLAKNPCCRRCCEAGICRAATHVHHTVERNLLPPADWYRIDLLEATCGSCHTTIHNARRRNG